MKILSVDDNKENLYFLETLLKGNGYQVISATNGAEALEKLRTDGYDLIISDILMPIMDGFQLCRECKADEDLRKIPFVFYTATYVDEKDEDLALTLGADRFIRKPMEPDEFMGIIRGIVGNLEAGKLVGREPVVKGEEEILKLYSERLVNKLERKMLQLEAEVARRKQAEEQLRQSEEKYRLLVENASEAIVVAQDGMLKFANPKTVEFSGYSREELISMPFADIIHPDDRDIVIERYLRRLQGESLPSPYYFRVLNKAGDVRWVEINVVSIIWEGKPATLNFLADITNRKKAEQKALMNAKLASVGELVSGVAHEMNNPLTGIIGYAQLLADRQDVPQNIKDDLQKIHEESQRTVKIVQNLLRFARQYKPEKDLADINDLLGRILELEAYKLRTSNVEVSTKLATDIPLILADYNQLQQVILNIITNARQAMEETGRKGKIKVITENVKDYVRISIADNGSGISRENMAKIFDPFFTTKPVGIGSGLGLSVCHGIITEHGGNIFAESTKGKGTTFIIELPVATKEPAKIEDKEATKKNSQRPKGKKSGNIS